VGRSVMRGISKSRHEVNHPSSGGHGTPFPITAESRRRQVILDRFVGSFIAQHTLFVSLSLTVTSRLPSSLPFAHSHTKYPSRAYFPPPLVLARSPPSPVSLFEPAAPPSCASLGLLISWFAGLTFNGFSDSYNNTHHISAMRSSHEIHDPRIRSGTSVPSRWEGKGR
jgi:hypothetical protein